MINRLRWCDIQVHANVLLNLWYPMVSTRVQMYSGIVELDKLASNVFTLTHILRFYWRQVIPARRNKTAKTAQQTSLFCFPYETLNFIFHKSIMWKAFLCMVASVFTFFVFNCICSFRYRYDIGIGRSYYIISIYHQSINRIKWKVLSRTEIGVNLNVCVCVSNKRIESI